MKLIALELRVLLCERLLTIVETLELRVLLRERLLTIVGTEQSDQPEFMHGMYFSSLNSYLQLREPFSTLSILWKLCKSFYCSWSEN